MNKFTIGQPSLSLPSSNVQGIQLDPLLSTLEFTQFQEHWLSANKTTFPGCSFDNNEVRHHV